MKRTHRLALLHHSEFEACGRGPLVRLIDAQPRKRHRYCAVDSVALDRKGTLRQAAASALPRPISAKARFVPTPRGIRVQGVQLVAPTLDAMCERDLKGSVAHGHLRAFDRAPEHRDLLVEHENLKRQCAPALEPRCEGPDNRKQETKRTERCFGRAVRQSNDSIRFKFSGPTGMHLPDFVVVGPVLVNSSHRGSCPAMSRPASTTGTPSMDTEQ